MTQAQLAKRLTDEGISYTVEAMPDEVTGSGQVDMAFLPIPTSEIMGRPVVFMHVMGKAYAQEPGKHTRLTVVEGLRRCGHGRVVMA